jgi:nicotinamidase-related amidase
MRITLLLALSFAAVASASAADDPKDVLTLHTRARTEVKGNDTPIWVPVEKTVKWEPKKTALIICDMWDDHWCKNAAARVNELAGPMNEVVKKARSQGVFIIHAPSTCMDFYKDTPQRKRAQDAPFSKTPVPLSTEKRWGTCWCWPDKKRESDLPIDDSDMGCDCKEKCKIHEPWKRQIKNIEIAEADAITDDGQETWNLLAERDIDNVFIMGVHLNMCVLGRPFGIRQLGHLGKNVVLVRDMTDTMYNPDMKPKVSHFEGTDLVVEHIEKYWCPSITSVDIVGGKPFHFKEDTRR